jgi:predicted DNA-binding WGR domain protein
MTMLEFFAKRIDATRNARRWYSVHLQPRLFGGVDVVCAWGRLGYAGGSERSEFFEDVAAAKERVEELRRLRIRRGYRLHSRTDQHKAGSQSLGGRPCGVVD